MRTLTAVVTAVLALGAISSCSHGPVKEASRPTLSVRTCPPEVDNVLMSGYSCADLTVPGKDGADPARLLVTTIEPTSGVEHPDPLVAVGEDLLTTLNYAGLAPAADRTGRTLLLVTPRGVAGSTPDLDCPDADALAPSLLPDGARGVGTWLDAVTACGERLSGQGLDDIDQAELASDVIALTQALHLKQWNVGAWGTSGRVALEILQAHPDGLRSVFLDSPELPGDDPLATAGPDTRGALARVLHDCSTDAACRHLPHSLRSVDSIMASLDRDPWDRTVRTNGAVVRVRLDGDTALRLVRHMLSNSGASYQYLSAGTVPAFLEALKTRRPGRLDEGILAPIVNSPAYCEGYVPSCQSFHHLSLGAFLSMTCAERAGNAAQAATDAVGRAFADTPYTRACDTWPVDHRPLPAGAVTSGVPVLAMFGRYDPYLDPGRLRRGLAGLSHLTVVEVSAWGHNAISAGPCVSGIRNAFVDHPHARQDLRCVRRLPSRAGFLPNL